MAKSMANVNDVLDRIRGFLDEGKAQEALATLSPLLRSGSKAIINAYGVCLMRLGQHAEAVKLLRGLVYQGNTLALANDVPAAYRANFATALLLSGNVDGCERMMKELDGGEPAVAPLKAALDSWRNSLSFFQRFQRLYSTPSTPVAIDFPPGHI